MHVKVAAEPVLLLCPAGLTKMVSKLSKEGAYKKGLEVRKHNKWQLSSKAPLRALLQVHRHAINATASGLWSGTLSNRVKHRQPCASEYLPCLTATVAWGIADTVLEMTPFSPPLPAGVPYPDPHGHHARHGHHQLCDLGL